MNKLTILPGTGLMLAASGFAAPDKPNIVRIFVDDLGYGDSAYRSAETCS